MTWKLDKWPTGALVISDESGNVIGWAVNESDGRLMALAPELMAALRQLEPIAHGYGGENPRHDLLNAATARARSVLARAGVVYADRESYRRPEVESSGPPSVLGLAEKLWGGKYIPDAARVEGGE